VRCVLAVSCAVLLVQVAPLAAATENRDAFFEYLHIEANSGSSSGGHAAVCFGEWCFHFQQGEDRTLRLHREPAARFDQIYRALGNRTIHAYRVPVPASARAAILNAFEDLYAKQQRDFERRDTANQDRQLLEQLAVDGGRRVSGKPILRLPGSGYFLEDQRSPSATISDGLATACAAGAGQSTAIARIARRIRARYGPHGLEGRALALGEAVRDLLEPPRSAFSVTAASGSAAPGFSSRYRELLSAWLAVEVLRAGPALRPGSLITVPVTHVEWDQRAWDAMGRFQARLEDALVELYGSRRADWGYPMLIGLARIAAFEEALSRHELAVLDVFREDAEVVPAPEVSRYRHLLSEVLLDRYADLRVARDAFVESPSEMRWSRFETASNLAVELERALQRGAALRVHLDAPVPMKSATRGDWPAPRAAPATHARLVADTRARADRIRDELAEAYGYDLFRRNCVTGILEELDVIGVTPDGENADAAVGAAYADLASPLRFIPFVSAYVVRGRLGGTRRDRLSYRQLVLARMESAENPLLVHLRESNVLTSTIYEPNRYDPIFLFFTDDSVLWRPLEGVANLTVATAAAAAGALLFPVDAGTTLRRALNGVASSVPEIFFISIRKGSFPFASQHWLDHPNRGGPQP
jgi:hypothetical protein